MASKALTERIDKIKELVEELKSEFEEKFDSRSEAWQESERGEACMSNIEACQNAIDALEEIE